MRNPPREPRALDRVERPQVLAAISEVSCGRVFDLGTELSANMPCGPRDTFAPVRIAQYRTPTCLRAHEDPPAFDFSMDVITGSPHLGTHLDAFVHVQSRGRVFGGREARETFDDFGWTSDGVETVPPIVTSGVLLDVARTEGVGALPDGVEIGIAELARCVAAEGVDIRVGDAVLVRTGKFARDYAGDGDRYFTAGPGVGIDGALWLYEQGMALLGTDTTATEPAPFSSAADTVHRAMLVERGVHLIEIMDLEELTAAEMYRFLFVCLPLKFRGATGSWVRPIAVA